MRIRKWFGVPVAIALLAGLMLTVGVSAQDEGQPSFPINITFLNAMTAQQEIDVFVNGSDKDQRVVEGLKYGEFSDVFEGSSPVTNIIIKRNVNLGFDQWLFNTVVPTEAGRQYVVVVSDFVIVPVEINTTATQEGNGRARVVHGSSQAPSIDVLVNDDVVIEGLQYGRASDAGELPAGEYSVKLNAAGTSTTALDLGQVPVEANKSYVLIAIGEPGSTEEPLTVVSYAVDVVVG